MKRHSVLLAVLLAYASGAAVWHPFWWIGSLVMFALGVWSRILGDELKRAECAGRKP